MESSAAAAKCGKLNGYDITKLREWTEALGLDGSLSKEQLCLGLYKHYGVPLEFTDLPPSHPDDVLTQLDTLYSIKPEQFEESRKVIQLAAVALAKTRKRASEIRTDIESKKKKIDDMAHEFKQSMTESINSVQWSEYAQTMAKLVSEREAAEVEEGVYAAHIRDIETKVGPLRSVFSGGCCVCFEEYDSDKHKPMAINPCYHVVCESCTKAMGSKCPQCRKKKNHIHRLYI
jgi:hypothetical protein